MNIEEAIKRVEEAKKEYATMDGLTDYVIAIETLLTTYEQKCNYIKENEIYKKNLFNSYEEKCKELKKEIQDDLDVRNRWGLTLQELEKEKEKNKNARERIEYYLVGNMRLNDFDERNKELRKLEKILEE